MGPTSSLPDVQDVANDLLGVSQGLTPGHLDLSGRHRDSSNIAWGPRQPLGPQHSQPGTGLGGASTVLCHALIDGLIFRPDSRNGQCAAGQGKTQMSSSGSKSPWGSAASQIETAFFQETSDSCD